MSISPPPRMASFIPESAPFTPEQRIWLNGLFAGVFGLQQGVTPLSDLQSAQLLSGLAGASERTGSPEADDAAPWHDPAIPIAERMTLADGKPLPRRLMAAMAQQDCGQCGYNCKDYADALFAKSEQRLNLCVPGGKETARMLKQLHAELDGSAPAVAPDSAPAAQPLVSEAGRSRDNPVYATFLSRRRLNGAGSEKETWHIDVDLAGTALDYEVGDSFGIFPANDHALVDAIVANLGIPPDFPIGQRTFRDVLIDGVSLAPAPDMLFQLISLITGGERRQKAKTLAEGKDPDGDAANLDVLAALQKFPGIRPDPEAFIESLDPLQPRVYSISSSPKAHGGMLSLTVDAVRYEIDKRVRLGVCSTWLGGRVQPGDKIRVYVQKSKDFALPADPSRPVIMIGPGTGIAPFRAFLHERHAAKAAGKNWLFFGHQRRDCDFFYEEELASMKSSGHLTRLTLAWSRDGKDKIYVQHRMREVGRDLWAWINEGAHIYVCGDALRMAKDVEAALIDVIAEHGGCSPQQAKLILSELKQKGRYQADVY